MGTWRIGGVFVFECGTHEGEALARLVLEEAKLVGGRWSGFYWPFANGQFWLDLGVFSLSLGPWNRARKAVLHLEKDSAQKYAESD